MSPEVRATPHTLSCRDCAAGRAHCHGTLICHPGLFRECTEPECGHPEALLHSLTVDCDALGCECGVPRAGRLAM